MKSPEMKPEMTKLNVGTIKVWIVGVACAMLLTVFVSFLRWRGLDRTFETDPNSRDEVARSKMSAETETKAHLVPDSQQGLRRTASITDSVRENTHDQNAFSGKFVRSNNGPSLPKFLQIKAEIEKIGNTRARQAPNVRAHHSKLPDVEPLGKLNGYYIYNQSDLSSPATDDLMVYYDSDQNRFFFVNNLISARLKGRNIPELSGVNLDLVMWDPQIQTAFLRVPPLQDRFKVLRSLQEHPEVQRAELDLVWGRLEAK